jgi:hypothetical protein
VVESVSVPVNGDEEPFTDKVPAIATSVGIVTVAGSVGSAQIGDKFTSNAGVPESVKRTVPAGPPASMSTAAR